MKFNLRKSDLLGFAIISSLTFASINSAEAAKIYRIGDTGPGGGIVFYVNSTPFKGDYKYLEVTPQDISGSTVWCDPSKTLVGGNTAWQTQPHGSGASATDTIASQCITSAASIAKGYVSPTGKSDWYLPTVGEASLIRSALLSAGLGIPDSNIWTSSEFDANLAWMEDLRTGIQNMDYKYHKWAVRAIRKF